MRRETDGVVILAASLQRLGGETVSAAERRLRHGWGGQPTRLAMLSPRYSGFKKLVTGSTSSRELALREAGSLPSPRIFGAAQGGTRNYLLRLYVFCITPAVLTLSGSAAAYRE